MPRIEVETAAGKQEFVAEDGRKLVLAIEDAGVDILHRCGGNAKCTTCRVEVLGGDPGEMGETERNRLALELHDAVSQKLFSLVLTAESAVEASELPSVSDREAAELESASGAIVAPQPEPEP